MLRYLFGPGKREEHRDPHLVAAWSGPATVGSLQPATTVSVGHDVRALARLLEQPVRAGKNPPARPVWHASVRNHVTDRRLSDAQWAHIAAEMVAAIGIAPHGDLDGVRWVAVRHADDHIHVVATLVRQDGATVWAWNERYKAQAAARDLEERYGLYRVGPADGTSHRRPKLGEQHKAVRQDRSELPRDRLRREVRAAATVAREEREFFGGLGAAGVLVRLRYSATNPGEVTGYAVGLPDHRTAAGDIVWYGGGRLAPDLTLPKLRRRWHSYRPGASDRILSRSRVDRRARAFRAANAATRHAAGCSPRMRRPGWPARRPTCSTLRRARSTVEATDALPSPRGCSTVPCVSRAAAGPVVPAAPPSSARWGGSSR